jgi:hypothetical protein
VATVAFILTALVVVPLQLSTLVQATNKQREKEKKQRRRKGKERRARVRRNVGGVAPVISVDMSGSFDRSGSFDDMSMEPATGPGLSGAGSFLDQTLGFETVDDTYDSFDDVYEAPFSSLNPAADGMQREVSELRRTGTIVRTGGGRVDGRRTRGCGRKTRGCAWISGRDRWTETRRES